MGSIHWCCASEAAILLERAWGGERPPPGVLETALHKVRSHVDGWKRVDTRKGAPFAGAGWPTFDLDVFEVGGGMHGCSSADLDSWRVGRG